MPAPSPLPDLTGLVFAGEPEWPAAVITSRQVQLLNAAPNPSGRPNSDVIRGYVGFTTSGTRERWQIDFPPHFTEQEAGLYGQPFAMVGEKVRDQTENWWVNPFASVDLRNALARTQRYLATPLAFTEPAWTWIEGDWLPDETLVVVARDDDFTQAVVQSRIFATWWEAHHETSDILRITQSFPFPWSLTTPLGSLTGLQQDLRFDAIRAARAGDSMAINQAVSRIYGWPLEFGSAELVSRLGDLHQRRMNPSRRPFG